AAASTTTASPRRRSTRRSASCDGPRSSSRSAGHEVLGPGVVADQRRGRLLRVVLEPGVLVAGDPDALGAEQLGHGLVVLEVRARRISPGVAAAAVALAEQPVESTAVGGGRVGAGWVLVRESPLLADAPVPVLGERLGHLHAEAVQEQIVLVLVRREQLGGALRDRRAHRHDLERHVVEIAGVDRPEEVRDAQERLLALAGERETGPFLRAGLVG